MTPLERKMIEYVRIERKAHKLQVSSISEKRYYEEQEKLKIQLKSLGSEITKYIEEQQEELERAAIFFNIITDPYSRRDVWYYIVELVKEKPKHIPKIIYNFVKKILDKEEAEQKRLMKILESYK